MDDKGPDYGWYGDQIMDDIGQIMDDKGPDYGW